MFFEGSVTDLDLPGTRPVKEFLDVVEGRALLAFFCSVRLPRSSGLLLPPLSLPLSRAFEFSFTDSVELATTVSSLDDFAGLLLWEWSASVVQEYLLPKMVQSLARRK